MAELESTVLVADDEIALADLYATWLAEDNDVVVAYDGNEALTQFDDTVDVVLLDRKMPGPAGEELLTEIRGQDADTQVAMVTAVDPDFEIIEMGFDAYLVKPVSKDDLVGVVEELAARADCDGTVQEYCSVAWTKAALEATTPVIQLENSEQYQQLLEQFQTLKTEVDDAGEVVSLPENFAESVPGRTLDTPQERPSDDSLEEDDEGSRGSE